MLFPIFCIIAYLFIMLNLFRNSAQWLFRKPVLWAASQFSSAPKETAVFDSLTHLYQSISTKPGKKGLVLPINLQSDRLVIFSDVHKGSGDGSDDFKSALPNYLMALDFYNTQRFHYVNLGDSEELWENTLIGVMQAYSQTFEAEKKFVERNAFTKIYGNHDLFWDNDPFAPLYMKKLYGKVVPIYSGIVLRVQGSKEPLDIFCTHGHQGDQQSDGNAFSKWFVSYIWGPLQSFLRINPNSPSSNEDQKTAHNHMMYAWSAQQSNTLLITGHTHQPVFQSLTHLERLYLRLEEATAQNNFPAIQSILKEIPRRRAQYGYVNTSFKSMKPTYFNTGCCCFANGTITGIEIAEGKIRLIKWSQPKGREVLEEADLG
jgi:UDP-2,3-diacylglucosamine pyrophosphatase LpxH